MGILKQFKTAEAVEIRKRADAAIEAIKKRANAAIEAIKAVPLLRAMSADPDATQADLAVAIGLRSKSTINKRIQKLAAEKLVEATIAGKWRLTPKGRKSLKITRTQPLL
jgi:Mn-dependent DtxR family transcriptional regulator